MNTPQSHNFGIGFVILGVAGLSVMAHNVLTFIGLDVMPRVVFAAVAGFFVLALLFIGGFAAWLDKREATRRQRDTWPVLKMEPPIRSVCAWCDTVTSKADLTHEHAGAISHGICPACAKKYFPVQSRD